MPKIFRQWENIIFFKTVQMECFTLKIDVKYLNIYKLSVEDFCALMNVCE